MADEMVRWGIISTAHIATQRVVPAVKRGRNVEIAAISSRNLTTAKQSAEALGIPTAYGSYDELLADPTIDAVYNPLPNGMHHEWTIKAARAGKHVLCEKPAADNAVQAHEMMDACREHGVLLMEAFMYRFSERNLRAREIVFSGLLGEVNLIRSSFSFSLPRDPDNVRFSRKLSGGALGDAGTYPVSAVRFLLGEEPMSIDARLTIDPEFGVDMAGVASMGFASGCLAVIDFSFQQDRRQSIEVVGTNASMQIDQWVLPSVENKLITITNKGEQIQEEFGPADTYKLEFESMSDSILNGVGTVWDGEDLIRQATVLDGIRESHDTGQRVGVRPPTVAE